METYTPGHSTNATDFMLKRSFASHGGFFATQVGRGMSVLDCGCGPGSITCDIAERVAPAEVVGVDFGSSQIERATAEAARRRLRNVRFIVASCYELPFADRTFDRVFSHALVEHLAEPRKAFAEFHRVLRPGGIAGICSPDWSGFVIAPGSVALSRAIDAYGELQKKNGGDVTAGGKLGTYLADAGFSAIHMDARYECYPSLPLIGDYLALQLEKATFATEAETLRTWSKSQGGLFAQTWISAVGRK